MFIYGGCGGNGNNYESKEDCEKMCLETTSGNECSHQNDLVAS